MVFCRRKNRCAELNILALQGVPSPAFSDSFWKALAGKKWAHTLALLQAFTRNRKIEAHEMSKL